MYSPTRRTFIRQAACAALGASGLVGTIWDLRKLNAAIYPVAGDYKALVCVFLHGGNDGNNVIIPHDAAGYTAYTAARSVLAIPQSSLLPITLPVVIENRSDSVDIARTRVACDQSLNELPANERTDVRMIKYCVERHLKILLRALTSRNYHAVQNMLFASRMVDGYIHHRLSPVLWRVHPNGRA